MLFVISGPSGSGKSTLVEGVLNRLDNILFSVSHTTRPKRKGEKEGVDYHFITEEKFKQMIGKKKFVEWAVVHGNFYGTSHEEIAAKSQNGDLLLDIDVQGAQQIKVRAKKALFVFVVPPDFETLKRRLKKRRTESPLSIRERLSTAKHEMRYHFLFDYLIINDGLDLALKELESVIRSARCRLAVRKKELRPILLSFKSGKVRPQKK